MQSRQQSDYTYAPAGMTSEDYPAQLQPRPFRSTSDGPSYSSTPHALAAIGDQFTQDFPNTHARGVATCVGRHPAAAPSSHSHNRSYAAEVDNMTLDTVSMSPCRWQRPTSSTAANTPGASLAAAVSPYVTNTTPEQVSRLWDFGDGLGALNDHTFVPTSVSFPEPPAFLARSSSNPSVLQRAPIATVSIDRPTPSCPFIDSRNPTAPQQSTRPTLECPECGMIVSKSKDPDHRQSKLAQHDRIEHGHELPLHCPEHGCWKAYHRLDALQEHLEDNHGGSYTS